MSQDHFDLMYSNPNRCYFHCPDGTLDFFLQENGFPQGNPFSPALACLVIHRFLKVIVAQLSQRVKTHWNRSILGDDSCGSKLAFQAYSDLPFVLHSIQTDGRSKGISMNKTKTKIPLYSLPP
jgi:hypothetical protein